MAGQLALTGYSLISIYERTGGCNLRPHTIKWRVWGYTKVDACNYSWLNQYQWLKMWSQKSKSYYVVRHEYDQSGKQIHILMSREVLGLPRVAGNRTRQADHKNHDTLDNRLENLRVATTSQNGANNRANGKLRRFRGISRNGSGFLAQVVYKYQTVNLPTVRTDVEAALTYNYAARVLFGEFSHWNSIPDNEMPVEERLEELWQMVLAKLRIVGLLAEV